MANKKRTILAFGNPVFDVISTPELRRDDRVLSGCSTNACLAATKLGENAILVGSVGQDYHSRLLTELSSRKIQHNLFLCKQTGGFGLIYDERGDRELSILGIADPIPANADGYQPVDFILLGPILGEISFELAKYIRKTQSAPILLDPQGLLRILDGEKIIHQLTPDFQNIARLSTIVKANELETKTVTGINPRVDPEKAVRGLHEYGCEIAVVTLAEAGSIIFDGKNIYEIPPFSTRAIDPTGAGDTYAAGFMVKYLETPHDLTAVGCFASAVASVMVENSGPDFPLNREEADRRTRILLQGPLALKL